MSVAPTTTDTRPGESAAEGLGPGDHLVELEHDGLTRRYIIHVPRGLVAPTPVVVALHGGGGTAPQLQGSIGLDAIADREGFLAVYPYGTGLLEDLLHTWNAGADCCGYAARLDIDDVGFLRAVVGDIVETTTADAERIYVTGHSNGAMMSYRFAAEATELVAAIAPVGGASRQRDQPTAPVPLLHIHSVDDPRAIYEGGEGPPFPGTSVVNVHDPVISGIDAWRLANNCGAVVVTGPTIFGAGENEGHTATTLTWQDCDAPVVHLQLTGAGHGWPGATTDIEALLGPLSSVVIASEEVWAFVSQHSRS